MNNTPQLGTFESIAITAIRPSGTNPRKHFDPLALAELQRSIEEMGVTQPLLLRPWPAYRIEVAGTGFLVFEMQEGRRILHSFHGDLDAAEAMRDKENKKLNPLGDIMEIVSGERRWRAATAAGLDGVPAIVRDLTDAEALDIQMIENLHHTKLARLTRSLNVPKYAAVGILESLWHLTAREAPEGNIGKLPDEDIAAVIDWRGDAAALIESLVSCGWLDRDPADRLIVHDWLDHVDNSPARATATATATAGAGARATSLSAPEADAAGAGTAGYAVGV